MPLLPLHGHRALRARLDAAVRRDALPGSILLHGPRGAGKQRLAQWLGQRLLCDGAEPRPCGVCQQCRYALAGTHPDIHWFFPRPRLKDADPSLARVADDFREAIGERLKSGAYPPPPPQDGILISTIRAAVHSAVMAPALAARTLLIIGDADRMVVREGAEESAGAFLKLLEEPPSRGTIVLTSSEPGALIPTIRSRVVAIRVPAMSATDTAQVLAEPAMQAAVVAAGGPKHATDQLRIAGGAPGSLLDGNEWADALARAQRMLDAARGGDRREQVRTSLVQGRAGARGAFTTSLDALTVLLHESVRASAEGGNSRGAASSARALDAVEQAKERATGNTNPQLVTNELLRHLERLLT
ncbi:MAG: hypothetical protein H0W68_06305 [Gemmatimonadaceae bacterium]|nr:hypothetical protein [Gemmatimonadaceae bacterium]